MLQTPIRLILTAYGFIQFAVQVLWLSKHRMPSIIKSNDGDIEKRQSALLCAHGHVNRYIRMLHRLNLINFEFHGTPMQKSGLIVANHPSLLDFIILLKDFPNAICLFKQQTRQNPVLSDFVSLAGYIEGMDGSRQSSQRIIDECSQRLHEGHHIAVFPEGTRSSSNITTRRFRSTIFHAAIKKQSPIQPVAIYCKPLFLGKNQSWLAFSKRSNTMMIRYLEPIIIEELPEYLQQPQALAKHVRQLIQTELITCSQITA